MGRSTIKWLWLLPAIWLAFGARPSLAQDPPLKLGLLPYNSTLSLLAAHQPLRVYLQAQLGRPVELYTATNFYTFVHNSRRGDYDLLLTAPHFARLAQMESGYIPLLRYETNLQPLLVLAKEDPIRDVSELRGKTVANPDRLALVTVVVAAWLQEKGMLSGRDYRMLESNSHANAILAVIKGEARAAIVSQSSLSQMPQKVQDRVRVIHIPCDVPHLIFLAHPRLPLSLMHRIKGELLDFGKSAQGKKFFADTSYEGFVPVGIYELERLDPYVNLLKRELEKKSQEALR